MASDNMPYFTCLDHTRASTGPDRGWAEQRRWYATLQGSRKRTYQNPAFGSYGVDGYMEFSHDVYTSIRRSSRIKIWPSYD